MRKYIAVGLLTLVGLHGDLDALIEHYVRNGNTHIPQPFILYVAESLFQAGLTMKKVGQADNGRQVVHRQALSLPTKHYTS